MKLLSCLQNIYTYKFKVQTAVLQKMSKKKMVGKKIQRIEKSCRVTQTKRYFIKEQQCVTIDSRTTYKRYKNIIIIKNVVCEQKKICTD